MEMYIHSSAADRGGSLYRVREAEKSDFFLYQHSTYNDDSDELEVFETRYETFEEFWLALTVDPEWYFLHPLFIHAEQRAFLGAQLQQVNWSVHADKKWQESHQRQWKKVLEDPATYYRQQNS